MCKMFLAMFWASAAVVVRELATVARAKLIFVQVDFGAAFGFKCRKKVET